MVDIDMQRRAVEVMRQAKPGMRRRELIAAMAAVGALSARARRATPSARQTLRHRRFQRRNDARSGCRRKAICIASIVIADLSERR